MNNLEVLTREEAPAESRDLFDQLKSKLGKVPNLYAVIGNSGPALQATLGIGEALAQGEFSDTEREVIALAVAQANDCDYCLAAHTTLGKMFGLSEQETVDIRNGEPANGKFRVLSRLVRAITTTRGFPEETLIADFYEAGYTPAALSEIIVLVALNTITNYTNHIAGTPIDFPLAPAVVNS